MPRNRAASDLRFFVGGLGLAAVVLFPVLLGSPLAASQTPAAEEAPAPVASEPFSDTVDVRIVNVEVVVTDADGVPVTGLTRDDFEILEDGEPVALTNFFAVEGRPVPEAASAERPASGGLSPVESLPADVTRSLDMVIFVDNLQIRPQNRKLLFDRLRDYLRQSSADDRRIMIATMDHGVRFPLPFTADLDQVFGVLDEVEKGGSLYALHDSERRMFMARLQNASLRTYRPPNVGTPGLLGDLEFEDAIRVALDLAENVRMLAERRTQQARASVEALGAVCEALAGLPGRKALIYLSDGIPQRPADTLIEAWLAKYEYWLASSDSDMRQFTRFQEAPGKFQQLMGTTASLEFDVRQDLDELARRASASRVVIYPISNAGRASGLISAETRGDGVTGILPSTLGFAREAQVTESFTRDASLLQIAENTGGLALLRSANVDLLLERVRQDFRSFYSLGYSPPHDGRDADFHRITVKVRREGLRVRHVEGYRNDNWRRSLGEETLAAALYGAESPNPLGVRLDRGEPTRDGRNFVVPIQVKIPFELIRMVHQDEHFNAQLTVLVLVSDEEDGGLSKTRRFDLPIKIPDARALEAMAQVATYPLELKMNRGKKRIAVGVHDHLGNESSVIRYEIVLGEDEDAGNRSRS